MIFDVCCFSTNVPPQEEGKIPEVIGEASDEYGSTSGGVGADSSGGTSGGDSSEVHREDSSEVHQEGTVPEAHLVEIVLEVHQEGTVPEVHQEETVLEAHQEEALEMAEVLLVKL